VVFDELHAQPNRDLYDVMLHGSGDARKQPLFFLINAYTTGLAPSVLKDILQKTVVARLGGVASADEVGIPVTHGGVVLPCGASGRWEAR
jgi:23S rRNA (cytosine1962-C5)-methyltransferase